MDDHFEQIRSTHAMPGEAIQQLKESGFLSIRGPLSGDRFAQLAVAYDQSMALAPGLDYRAGDATTRRLDLLSHSSVFDGVFLYPPLLEACWHLIGESFKLSSFMARTLRPGSSAQGLHADLPRDSFDAPMLGFILTVDPFHEGNGATRFVPKSHLWPDVPADRLPDTRAQYPGQVLSCGDPGTMILFNGAIWHGHTANVTAHPRRSIQGYFVRRTARSAFDFSSRLDPIARSRMSSLARILLALDD